jgi:glycosyltransferase involved in cell wall biosynthesis
MKPGKKKVLIITYYFPPSGGSGVQRTLKFIKYLRQFDWEPIILTAKDADYPTYDKSLWADVPKGIKIYYSKIFEPYRLYRKFTGKKEAVSLDVDTSSQDDQTRKKLSERISALLRSTFFIPDARIFWLFFAVPLAKKIIKKENIDLIYSSAPPYTTHLIGFWTKRFTHLPWIADFRDSWIGWHSAPQWRPKISKKIDWNMEDSVLKYADEILAVSSGVKKDLVNRHQTYNDNRWHILPNGFDEDDFCNLEKIPKDKKLTITYTGTFFGEFSPEYLLRATEELFSENQKLLQNLRLRFVGRIADSILQRIKSSPVYDLVEIIPYVPHKKGLAYLLASDYSFLIINDVPINRGMLTGKLFEYIGAGLPILALVPDGDAAELIHKNDLGLIVPPDDVNQIKEVILKMLIAHNKKEKIINPPKTARAQFTRKTLTRELAKLFNKVITENQN